MTVPVGYRLNWGEISPDGHRMVTSGYNGTTLWDLQTATGVSSPVTGVAIDRLFEVLPNPASDRFNLPFELARPGHVRLTLVNAMGEEVALIADGQFGAGRQSIGLDISGLQTGAYWCVMLTERGRKTVPVRIVR